MGLTGVAAGHMVRGVERVADQHRVGLAGVELTVGLKTQVIATQTGAALQRQRVRKKHRLGCSDQLHGHVGTIQLKTR